MVWNLFIYQSIETFLRILNSRNIGMKNKNRRKVSQKWIFILCVLSFCLGMLLGNRIWVAPILKDRIIYTRRHLENFSTSCDDCETIHKEKKELVGEFSKAHEAIESLDSSITKLRMELPSNGKTRKVGKIDNFTTIIVLNENRDTRKKVFMVIGINTAFSSRKRRDSIRETWMPRGKSLLRLEQEKEIIVRFMIGHSATSNSILDRAIDLEDSQHQDFLRLDHIEGYHELSAKTKSFFSTAVRQWDAEFYVKVDDDVHVNLGTLAATLARHRSQPRVYIGCMKSGPVLHQKNVKYHEPEYWKFGEEGNKYFRHANGQIYAISKELANYVAVNQMRTESPSR